MSSFFVGPQSITPWISTTVFDAILGKPIERRPKIVQVTSTGLSAAAAGSSETHKDSLLRRLVRISDGTTEIIAVIPHSIHAESMPSTGCVVKITEWCVYPLSFLQLDTPCQEWSRNGCCKTADDTQHGQLACLYVYGRLEILGGRELGVVGDPVDVHTTVDVRQALDSIKFSPVALQERLERQSVTFVVPASVQGKIPHETRVPVSGKGASPVAAAASATSATSGFLPVGNVAALLASQVEAPDNMEGFFAVAERAANGGGTTNRHPTRKATPSAHLPVGDVAALFAAATNRQPTNLDAAFRTAAPPTAATLVAVQQAPTMPTNISDMHQLFSNVLQAADALEVEPVIPAQREVLPPTNVPAMQQLFSNVLDAAKAAEKASNEVHVPSSRATAATAQASSMAVTQEEMILDDDEESEPDDDGMGISDMLQEDEDEEDERAIETQLGHVEDPVESQDEQMETQAEANPESPGDEESEPVLETQQAAIETQLDHVEDQVESQDEKMETQAEAKPESHGDEESEPLLETQQAAPIDTGGHDALSDNAHVDHASVPPTSNGSRNAAPEQKRPDGPEWVNMDLVESGIVAIPRTETTPMLTIERWWRRSMTTTNASKRRRLSRNESSGGSMGGDGIRAMLRRERGSDA